MKELSIEEKAKRYDEALEAIKSLQEVNPSDEGIQNWVNENFPELKESEDEKIRRNIIAALKGEGYYDCDLTNECIAWLEKKGESDETKAKTFLIDKGYPIDANGTFPTYEEMYDIIKEGLEKQDKQKLAWSEEDKNRFTNLISLVKCSKENNATKAGFIEFINRLKSLRPQNTWKPSDKQMEALEFVIKSLDNMFAAVGCMDNYTKPRLEEILEALKKLMEE